MAASLLFVPLEHELPRIRIPRTWVNKGIKKGPEGVTTKGRQSTNRLPLASGLLAKY
jgi:hypothetical protein